MKRRGDTSYLVMAIAFLVITLTEWISGNGDRALTALVGCWVCLAGYDLTKVKR